MLYYREVWPGAEFGSSGMSVDEEVEGIRDILLNTAVGGLNFILLNVWMLCMCVDVQRMYTLTALPVDRLVGAWPGGGDSGDEGDGEEEGGDSSGPKTTTIELEFNINKYIERWGLLTCKSTNTFNFYKGEMVYL